MNHKVYTDIGKRRALKKNEDDYFVSTSHKTFAVFDGMGGEGYGDLASQLCKKALQVSLEKHNDFRELIEGFVATWKSLLRQQPYWMQGCGSTAVICQIKDDKLFVCNIGDSRCTIIRDSEVIRKTVDQNHKYYPNVLLNCMTLRSEVNLDEIFSMKLQKNDKILLTSDGIHDYMDFRQVNEETFEETRKKILEGCNKMDLEIIRTHINDLGSKDNHTALLVNWE